MFLLCFAVLVVATSAASVCKCEDKKVQFNWTTYYKYNCYAFTGFQFTPAISCVVRILWTELSVKIPRHLIQKRSGKGISQCEKLYKFEKLSIGFVQSKAN